MTIPGKDWSYAEGDGDEGMAYDGFDKDVGKLAVYALDHLSRRIADFGTDLLGWTESDYHAVGAISEIDWLERLLVPPATTPLDNRVAFNEGVAALRNALPFTEAERGWLFDDPDEKSKQTGATDTPGSPEYIRTVRRTEAHLMSSGVHRVVRGRHLIERWSAWRRETGEYADGVGLNQARESLKGIAELLTPSLGLPESYLLLRGVERLSKPGPDFGL